MQVIRAVALAQIVGWVKRDNGINFVGFAVLNVPQQSTLESKIANPTRSIADHRLNPTYESKIIYCLTKFHVLYMNFPDSVKKRLRTCKVPSFK